MMCHKSVLTGLAVAVLMAGRSACVVAAPGYRSGYVEVGIAPTPVRIVAEPVFRPGYVWAPGYWAWNGRQHVWRDGYYVHARPGYHWHAAYWEQHSGRYRFREGRWER